MRGSVKFEKLLEKSKREPKLGSLSEKRYEILEDRVYINVEDINTERPACYNRPIKFEWAMKIARIMEREGYHPSQVVELNDKYQIIDGQHRVVACMFAGITKIPVTIYKFKTLEDEAAFYNQRNTCRKDLAPREQWHSKRVEGNPLAVLLYKMVGDVDSSLYRCIDLSKTTVTINQDRRVTASLVVHVVNLMVTGTNLAYKKEISNKIDEGIRKLDYVTIRDRINQLFNLFYGLFGSRSNTPLAYNDRIFRSYLSFFKKLMDAGRLSKGIDEVKKKMKDFKITASLKELDQEDVVRVFTRAYNKGRTTNKI